MADRLAVWGTGYPWTLSPVGTYVVKDLLSISETMIPKPVCLRRKASESVPTRVRGGGGEGRGKGKPKCTETNPAGMVLTVFALGEIIRFLERMEDRTLSDAPGLGDVRFHGALFLKRCKDDILRTMRHSSAWKLEENTI